MLSKSEIGVVSTTTYGMGDFENGNIMGPVRRSSPRFKAGNWLAGPSRLHMLQAVATRWSGQRDEFARDKAGALGRFDLDGLSSFGVNIKQPSPKDGLTSDGWVKRNNPPPKKKREKKKRARLPSRPAFNAGKSHEWASWTGDSPSLAFQTRRDVSSARVCFEGTPKTDPTTSHRVLFLSTFRLRLF